MLPWVRSAKILARLPDGERVYAIGDVHGEAMLLGQLLAKIAKDNVDRGHAKTSLIVLGDVIDRGMDSAGLLRSLIGIENSSFILLKGNHEAALVDAYRGDLTVLRLWMKNGGRATICSFGIDAGALDKDPHALIDQLRARIDRGLIDRIDRLPMYHEQGDYLFVHAGIRPGVCLGRQTSRDLMGIREPFLSNACHHGRVVVHGHTLEQGVPRLGRNRIGIDTGAYEHGCLSALGLEGDQQWIIQAIDEGRASIALRPIGRTQE